MLISHLHTHTHTQGNYISCLSILKSPPPPAPPHILELGMMKVSTRKHITYFFIMELSITKISV